MVASELKRVRTTHGNESFFPGSADWQSAGLLRSASALVRRMLGLYGGLTDCSGDPSIAAAMVILPHVVGELEVYDEQTAWPMIEEHTDLLVLLAADLLKDNQIGTHPSDHYAYGALERFRAKVEAKRARVIAIDPRPTDTVNYLGASWIAPRPNTDTALMLGIAYVLHEETLADRQFIAKYTVGFDKFLDYLTGRSDGRPKSPAWAAEVTDIGADTIRDLARQMAQHRTMIISGYAIQRADHGEQPYWMLVTLAAMLGQIGLPGEGYGVSYHYDNGGDVVAQAPDIRLIYWAGGNPLTHLWQTNKVVEA